MKKKTLHQLSGKISFGVRIASAFLLMANLILPGFQAFADPAPEQTLKWYYIHDEASWNTAYNALNSPLKKYLDSNRTEDRWSNTYNRACNSTDWDNQTNPTKFVDDAQCVPSWLGAINNPGAKYPWAALELPDTFNGTITFQYDGGEIKYPWGKHITRTNGYGIASIPEEIDMNFILNTNGETTFNPDNLVVKIIPETLDYLDENEEWFYIWNESTWNAAYDAEHPDVDLTDDSSFAKTPLHRYLDRNPDEDRWCDADGEGGNPGHYGQAVDKENNGGTWPNYCVQSWEGAINATDAKYPRIILGDNDIIPERHKGILVFKYKDAVKQTNKYNEYDVSENGWRLYYARSIPAEKDGLSWTEFLLENGETSFDKSKLTVLLVTHVNDAITLEKADETTPVEYEAQIGSQGYATVVEAINAAQNDEMVEILKSGHYVLPDISKSITIKGNVDGVTFDHEKISDNTYKISEISANVVFDNISFNLTGKANQDHKIVNTASITMSGCTFNGYIQTDGEIIFNNCKFNGKSAEYALYIGKGNVTVNGGEIIGQNGNIVNFFYYDNPLGTEQNTVRFDGTKFTNVGNARKSALNVKEVQRLSANEGHEDIFNYDITINNCTTEGEFPTDKKGESKLWMVDHLIESLDENGKAATRIENATGGSISYGTLNGGGITIKDGSDKVLYSTPIHQYTITWNYKTATGLDISDTTNVGYNTTPMHTESGYVLNYRNYTFASWAPELTGATADATYTATYTTGACIDGYYLDEDACIPNIEIDHIVLVGDFTPAVHGATPTTNITTDTTGIILGAVTWEKSDGYNCSSMGETFVADSFNSYYCLSIPITVQSGYVLKDNYRIYKRNTNSEWSSDWLYPSNEGYACTSSLIKHTQISAVHEVKISSLGEIVDTIYRRHGCSIGQPCDGYSISYGYYSLNGYVFGGYYTDPNFTDKWNWSYSGVTQNITLYTKQLNRINTLEISNIATPVNGAQSTVEGINMTSTDNKVTLGTPVWKVKPNDEPEEEATIDFDGTFTGGKSYRLYIPFTVADGYAIDKSYYNHTTLTVNGTQRDINNIGCDSEQSCYIRLSYTATFSEITNINLTGVIAPVGNATATVKGITLAKGSSGIQLGTPTRKEGDTEFNGNYVSGTQYSLYIPFKLIDSYVMPQYSYSITFTVNGDSFWASFGETNNQDYPYYLQTYFTAKTPNSSTTPSSSTSSSSAGGGGGGGSYSCKNLPSNATANNTDKPKANTNYSYSTDTKAVCTFQCNSGFTWNATNSKCEKSETQATTGDTALTNTGNTTTLDNSLVQGNEGNTSSDSNSQEILENGFTKEFNNAYEFAFRNSITTMPDIQNAHMYGELNRIAMAKMLSNYGMNILGKKPANVVAPEFTDVSSELNEQYGNAVTLAYQLGIMGINMPNNEFRPFDTVTRAEFGTALSRLLFGLADGVDAYYTTHLAKLKAEGIITNDDPTLQELRGYVMIMLMRAAK